LVLDEADRMTQEHCFPQLLSILQTINDGNPREEEDDDESTSDEDEEDEDRMLGLPGLRGEAKVTMLTDDLLRQIEEQKATSTPASLEVPDEEFPDEELVGDESSDEKDQPKVHRQTFIFSATLTLPVTSLNEKRRRMAKDGLDGGIAEILERARAMGETKVVDLSSSSKSSISQPSRGVRLPPGLVLEQVKCTKMHKDSHLYAYLTTTAQGSSGPCLVFCNSIAAVRRLGKTLECLRFPVRVMHAQMQQVR
jgi:ATP-dependent RNA helicase DDX24/MAK5